ncbi:MAG: hypothetical protein ACK4JA_00775 [Parazoarcus communis]
MNTRTTMLFGALALTLAAAGWLGMQEDETAPVSAAVERTERSAPRRLVEPATGAAIELPALVDFRARPGLPEQGAGFATPLSFRPPPPQAVVPRPMAPALPFRFVGALDDDGERTVMLMEGKQLHLVRQGDVLGERYRVERIDAQRLELLYLPLEQRQSIDLSSK